MADSKVSALDAIGSIDRTTDLLYVVDATGPTSNKVVINTALGISGGDPVSTTDTQTLTNKTLTTPTVTVLDNAFTVQDNSDATKQLQLQLSGITTGTTRTLTVPDANTTIVGTDTTQTLTNKTLTSPTVNNATIANPTLTVDTVSEYTAANGVTVDGLLIKDGALATNNSVVSSNIAADSVTDDKLVYGKVRSRQGGSATNWQTTGTTTYDYSATNVFTQVGSIASDASPKTITFPIAFAQNPVVFIQVTSASGANCFAHAGSISTTGFTCQVVTDGGAGNTAQNVNWMAIGQ